MAALQLDLLEPTASLPRGFLYRPELLSPEAEGELASRFAALPLREFEFHGYLGKRRVVSYGLRYDFADSRVHHAEPIPDFLLPLRDRAAAFAGLEPAAIEHALVTEYAPGAAIGWHRDRPVYGEVIGISFLSACRFRFRRRLGPHPSLPRSRGREGWGPAAAAAGSAPKSCWNRARPICCAALPAANGSTRSRRPKNCAIR